MYKFDFYLASFCRMVEEEEEENRVWWNLTESTRVMIENKDNNQALTKEEAMKTMMIGRRGKRILGRK